MRILRHILLLLAATIPARAGIIAPDLSARLTDRPAGAVSVVAYLNDAAPATSRPIRAAIAARRERAQATQGPLLSDLAVRGAVKVRALWAVNAVAFEASPGVVRAVASRPDVRVVEDDPLIAVPAPEPEGEVAGSGMAGSPSWNLQKIFADVVWGQGYRGDGVRVGVMDTGVDAAHVALAGRMAPGGWFDAVSNKPGPYDDNGHGTHVTGIICGGDVNGIAIGVAPDATYLAAKALNAKNEFQFSWVMAAGQWFLDPNGDGDPSDAPNVVNCSWAFFSRTAADYHPMLELWTAAGILPVFAIGNSGPSASTALSPGTDPLVFGVGAVNSSDVIASFSALGPAPAAAPFNGILKPDLVAPGVNIGSAKAGGGVTYLSGTSMAAPHVSGALALLCQRFPGIRFAEAWRRLTTSALDLGAGGPDSTYGYGRLNIYAAIQLPGPPGDANGDGFISPADAVLALKLAGGLVVDKAAAGRADVSAPNPRVDIRDAVTLLRRANGL